MKTKSIYLALVLLALISVKTSKAADIDGKVLYQGDIKRPIGSVVVTLKNIDNNTVQTYKTDNDGSYRFLNLPAGNYTVTGTTSIAGGGVTFYDAVMVFLNVIGYYQFTPMQFLAADVNANNKIEMGCLLYT